MTLKVIKNDDKLSDLRDENSELRWRFRKIDLDSQGEFIKDTVNTIHNRLCDLGMVDVEGFNYSMTKLQELNDYLTTFLIEVYPHEEQLKDHMVGKDLS